MKNTIVSLATVCSLLIGASGVIAADSKPAALRVLCYNIHYGQGNDGVYDVARLAQVIKAAKPDLVALQEIDVGVKRSGRVHQLRKLAELTGMAARFGPTQHYQGGLFGNGVLTRLPILDVSIHPLPYTEATKENVTYPRAAIVVTMQGRDGKPFRFISTHFQHGKFEEDRIAEAKAVNKLFADKSETIPTILAGDMNAHPDSEPMRILHQRWTNAMNKDAAPTAPSKAPRSRIDYILYRPASAFKVTESKVIDEPMASDHLPVFTVFELRSDGR